jgi:hypothetical protein
VERQDWVELGDLVAGEHLWTEDGPVEILATQSLTLGESVYNLEIHRHHVYQVAELGVLVHNRGFENYRAPREVPYRDPAHPGYNNGATHMDHEHAKVWGNRGLATRPLPAETNMRRGGHDAKLDRDYKELTKAFEDSGLSSAEARRRAHAAVQGEIDALRNSPPPRPMDPDLLDRLPSNPMHQ